ncbi:MAG: DUF192 domain-containing protein [Candidatus Omnitrophica bacterium]|nr:DUF192 domain-containing protein [Candidatus Omnitrophota bacterium]
MDNNRYSKFFLFILLSLGICACGQLKASSDQVCFENTCFDVEIADEREELMRGLMFREAMPSDHGMVFIFPNLTVHDFWMKNTLIPLDMIWMDYNRKIVHIESHVPPCEKDPCPSYGPQQASLYVLELNAGVAEQKGLRPGMIASFKFPSL